MSLQGCSYATLLLGRAGLIVAPAAQAQAPERALLSSTITPLGNLDNHVRARDTAGVADVPIDGARALLGDPRLPMLVEKQLACRDYFATAWFLQASRSGL